MTDGAGERAPQIMIPDWAAQQGFPASVEVLGNNCRYQMSQLLLREVLNACLWIMC